MRGQRKSRLVWARIFEYRVGQKVEVLVQYIPGNPILLAKGRWIEGTIDSIQKRKNEFPKIWVVAEYPAGKRCLYEVQEHEIRAV